MVGLSMALTIAVCIGAFTWIYLQVDPLTRDFVNAATAAPTKKSTATSAKAATAAPRNSNNDTVVEVQPTNTPKPPTPTPQGFRATHRVSLSIENNINMRPGPAVASGDPVTALSAGTEVQYMNETRNSEDPDADPGVQWMKVRTSDGIEGWVRADFLEPISG